MTAADEWTLPVDGADEGIAFTELGAGVRLYDVRGRWSDSFDAGSGTEKTGYAVHHSVSPVGDGSLQGDLAQIGAIHDYHTQHHGWPGIGYHRVIGAGRRIYLIANSATVRAHVANLNHLWIGWCLLGDWSNERPDEDRMEALRRGTQWETDQRQRPMQLAPHKRVNAGSTACPGGWASQDAWAGVILQPGTQQPAPDPPVPSSVDQFQAGRLEMYEAWLRDAESYAEYVRARREAWGIRAG